MFSVLCIMNIHNSIKIFVWWWWWWWWYRHTTWRICCIILLFNRSATLNKIKQYFRNNHALISTSSFLLTFYGIGNTRSIIRRISNNMLLHFMCDRVFVWVVNEQNRNCGLDEITYIIYEFYFILKVYSMHYYQKRALNYILEYVLKLLYNPIIYNKTWTNHKLILYWRDEKSYSFELFQSKFQ